MSFDNINWLISRQEAVNYLYDDETRTLNANAVDFYIAAASNMAEQHCGLQFGLHKRTLTLDGNGLDHLVLPEYPLLYVHTLEVDSEREFGAGTTLAAAELSWRNWGRVDYHNGVITRGRQNVRITYTAGYQLDGFQPGKTGLQLTVNSTLNTTSFSGINDTRFDGFGSNEAFPGAVNSRIAVSQPFVTTMYDRYVHKFQLSVPSSVATFEIDVLNSTAAWHLGFVSDKTGAHTYLGDFSVPPLPYDLRYSIVQQVAWWYKQSWSQGDGMLGMGTRNIGQVSESMPEPMRKVIPEVKAIWDRYRKTRTQ